MKINLKIVGIVFILLVICTTSVYAATVILSKDVTYDNKNSKTDASDVQGAIDELFNKVKDSSGNLAEEIRNDEDLKEHRDEDGNSIYSDVEDIDSLKKAINKDLINSGRVVKEMNASILNQGSSSATINPTKNTSTAILVIYAHSGFGTSSGLTATTDASSSTMTLTKLDSNAINVYGGTYGSSGSNYHKWSYSIYKVENVRTDGTIAITCATSTRGLGYWALMEITDDLGENITKGKIIDSGSSSKTLFPSQNAPAAILVMYTHTTFGTSAISATATATSNYAKMTLQTLKTSTAGASGGTYGSSGSCYDAHQINVYKVNNVDTAASLSISSSGSTNALSHWVLIR